MRALVAILALHFFANATFAMDPTDFKEWEPVFQRLQEEIAWNHEKARQNIQRREALREEFQKVYDGATHSSFIANFAALYIGTLFAAIAGGPTPEPVGTVLFAAFGGIATLGGVHVLRDILTNINSRKFLGGLGETEFRLNSPSYTKHSRPMTLRNYLKRYANPELEKDHPTEVSAHGYKIWAEIYGIRWDYITDNLETDLRAKQAEILKKTKPDEYQLVKLATDHWIADSLATVYKTKELELVTIRNKLVTAVDQGLKKQLGPLMESCVLAFQQFGHARLGQ